MSKAGTTIRARRTLRNWAGLLAIGAASHFVSAGEWTQWGGPSRDFKLTGANIKEKWADGSLAPLWKRDLGEGYSAIVCGGGKLYTMYRTGDDEHVIALSADKGATLWDYTYAAPLLPKTETSFGRGPNATPLLAGDRLVTIGFTSKLLCLNVADGKPLWSHDLYKDYEGTFLQFGYSSSPLLHNDTVILPTGSKSGGVMAFALTNGAIRWTSPVTLDNSYSTPILTKIGAKTHLVFVTSTDIVGLDADNGELLWKHAYKNQWDTHCTTPVDCGGGRLFFPSFGGGVALQITASASGVDAKELWTTKKVGAGQMNVVYDGEHLYGSSGSERASFYSAVSMKDGAEVWRERMAPAQSLFVDGRLLALDENGVLHMLKASPEKFEVLGKVELLQNKAWTAPTLVDGKLYMRDQKSILAVDLNR